MQIKESLKKIIEEQLIQIKPSIENFPWESDTHYGTWCVQTSKFVHHTVPLLDKTAAFAKGPLKEILLHHREEEFGHEKFAERDAAFFGRNPESENMMPEALALYESIDGAGNQIVESLFGYAFALENISARYCGYMAKRVLDHHQKPYTKKHVANVPASFLTLHAAVDIAHTESGWKCLNHLESHTYDRLADTMLKSFERYENFLHAVMKESVRGAA